MKHSTMINGAIVCTDRPITAEDRATLERTLASSRGEPQAPYQARVDAGLSLRQAAKILEIGAAALSDVEWGRAIPSDDLIARMERAYACVIEKRK